MGTRTSKGTSKGEQFTMALHYAGMAVLCLARGTAITAKCALDKLGVGLDAMEKAIQQWHDEAVEVNEPWRSDEGGRARFR